MITIIVDENKELTFQNLTCAFEFAKDYKDFKKLNKVEILQNGKVVRVF